MTHHPAYSRPLSSNRAAMRPVSPATAEPPLSCDTCLKEIPASVAQSLEGPDYVHHFCGPACYERWQATHTTADKT